MSSFETFDQQAVAASLPWRQLIDSIESELRQDRLVSPDRMAFDIPMEGEGSGSLLVMPAWIEREIIGVKLVLFSPNSSPSINASYVTFDGKNGRVKAVMDGDALTERRTAAASALASSYLSRKDARKLLLVGTGQLTPNMAAAHAAVRKLDEIQIWGRSTEKVDRLVTELAENGLPVCACRDLQSGCESADIVSCATSSSAPLVFGDWIKPGTHVDLVGSFKADLRESDDALVSNAELYVDTRAGALNSGDLCQPIEAGVIEADAIIADLKELALGASAGRQNDRSVTLFKSAGFSLEDLVAARMVCSPRPPRQVDR